MSSIVDRNTIFLDIFFDNKESILKNISHIAWKEKICETEQEVLTALKERENILSTSVGKNIAIPHCKSDCIKQPKLFVYKLSKFIEWSQNEQVDLVFAILTNDKNSDHLFILSKLSRGLLRKDNLEKIRNSSSKEKIYELLNGLLN